MASFKTIIHEYQAVHTSGEFRRNSGECLKKNYLAGH